MTDRLGLELTGHLVQDETPSFAVRDNGDPLLAVMGESLPGIDEIRSKVEPNEIRFFLYAFADFASRKSGRGGMCELFACGPADMTPERMRKMVWLCALHGITRYFVAQSFTNAGYLDRMGLFLSAVGDQQPWFREFRTFLDEADRASAVAAKTPIYDATVRFPQGLLSRALARNESCPNLERLLAEIELSGYTPQLIAETEKSETPVAFAFEDDAIVEERTGARFATAAEAVSHLALARPVEGRRRNVLLRRFADGSRVELDLNARPKEPIVGEPVARKWNLSLDAPNRFRVPFGRSRSVNVEVAESLKDVRLVARVHLPDDAAEESGTVEGAPMCLQGVRQLPSYRFARNGAIVAAELPTDALHPSFDPLYRETKPHELAKGTHTFEIFSGRDDDNYFLPSLLLVGDFIETSAGLKPRPATVGLGALADCGLGGFAGAATYSAVVEVPNRKGVKLAVDSGNAFTRVRLGGQDLGVRAWAPFEWEIPCDLLGRRLELTITIDTSVLPLFGPERPGTMVDKSKWPWPVSDADASPGLKECVFLFPSPFAEVKAEILTAFSGPDGKMRRERALKRMEMAERLAGGEFAGQPLRDGELRQFRSCFRDELRYWRQNPLNPDVKLQVFDIRAFGACGDGRTDDTVAFAAAVAKVREANGRPTVLNVPAGEYLLNGTGPKLSKNYGHVTICGLTNFVLRGAGPEKTRLVFGDRERSGVVLRACENTVVKGVSMAWRDPLFCQGTVEAFDREAGTVTLKVNPQTMKPTDSHYRLSPSRSQVCANFDPDGRILLGSWVFFTYEAEDLGNGRFCVSLDKSRPDFGRAEIPIGSQLVIPDRWGTHAAVATPRSRWCDFEEVWVRNSPGGAFGVSAGEYVTGYRCRVFPQEGLVFSANADAFYNSRGTYLAECEFRGQGDDAANSLGRCVPVRTQVDARTILHRDRAEALRPGDAMQLFRASTGALLATLHIDRSEPVKVDGMALRKTTFRENLPLGILTEETLRVGALDAKTEADVNHGLVTLDKVADVIYATQAFGVSFVCTSNRFASLRGIGVNAQCSNALIEGNVIENVNVAIQLSALMQWFEGPPPYNVVIRGNRIRDVNRGIGMQYDTRAGRPASVDLITGVRIESNRIERAKHPYLMRNASGVRFVGNEVVETDGAEAPFAVRSPDYRNMIRLWTNPLSFDVSRDGVELVRRTEIGMQLNGKRLGDVVGQPVVTLSSRRGSVPTPIYKKAAVDLDAAEAIADFGDWSLRLAARNDGVAYRFETDRGTSIVVEDEWGGVTVPDPEARMLAYRTERIGCEESVPSVACAKDIFTRTNEVVYLPLTYTLKGKTVAVTDSDVRDYPIWNLQRDGAAQDVVFRSVFARLPRKTASVGGAFVKVEAEEKFLAVTRGRRTFPWRTFALADAPAKICESDLVFALAASSDEGADFSWVKPGKVAWDWWNAFDNQGADGCNTKTYERFIDFAAKSGLEYVILDDGWSEGRDIWRFNSKVNVPHLIEYAEARGVGLVLWMAWAQALGDEERVARFFAKLGVRGFKVDFMDRGDADVSRFLERFAAACARHRLLVDYHGVHRPTGLQRRYPNVLNYEGVHGLEQMKAYKGEDMMFNDVAAFFGRLAAGPMDYTPGAMDNYPLGGYPAPSGTNRHTSKTWLNPGSVGTRCHQMALFVAYEAPLQMLADAPTKYEANAECLSFLSSVPVVWDETVGLAGTPDSFAAVARRKGEVWYVAAVNNGEARAVNLETRFLGAGMWDVEIFRDADDATTQPVGYRRETGLTLTAGDWLSFKMAPGGGFIVKIRRID